jgi:uncharacterized protein YxeA
MNILKQIFSFILPITVLIIVPLYIEKNISIHGNSPFWKSVLKIHKTCPIL